MPRLPIVLCLALTACSPQAAPLDSSVTLVPYSTLSPSPSPSTPEGLVVSNETPLPSPTPFTYVVQEGDTLSAIAENFGVSLDELQGLNPQVSPGSMPIGTVLNIPSGSFGLAGEPTHTPVPLTVKQIVCHPDAGRGLWCFVLVKNEFPDPLENLGAQLTLLGAGGEVLASQTAWLLLDILPVDAALPMIAFFPPGIPSDARPQALILNADRLLPEDDRYLPVQLQNILVEMDWSGRGATVSGQVVMPAGSSAAASLWVAGVAYDLAGGVVGARRWESGAGLQPGDSLPFRFLVASLAGKINRVELAVEARP